MIRGAAALLFALALGGCATTGGGSVAGGECKVFEAPKFAVRGATQYDQDWADSTVESGIGGCKWARPAPRPAELDTPRRAPTKAIAKPAKKPPLWLKLVRWPTKAVAPVITAPLEQPKSPPIIEMQPTPVAAPRSALDELLHPSEWVK